MADQLSFELIAKYKDQATAGLNSTKGTFAEFRAEVLKLAADESKLKFGRATDVVRFGEAWGTAGGQLKGAGLSAEETERALRNLAQGGLGPLVSELPGVSGAVGKLLSGLGGFPLAVGAVIGIGVGFISMLKSWQDESTKTLSSIHSMAEGIATAFRVTQAEIKQIRAESVNDAERAAEAQFQAAKIKAEEERDEKIRIARETRDAILTLSAIPRAPNPFIPGSASGGEIAGRQQAEGKLAADRAKANTDADLAIQKSAERRDAQLTALDKARDAAILQTAALRKATELEIAQIAASASHDRVAAMDLELQKSIATAQARKAATLQQLGPGVLPTDPRAIQAGVEAENAIAVAHAKRLADQKKLEEEFSAERIQLANTAAQQAIQGEAAVQAAQLARVAAAQERAGDEIAAEQTRASAVQSSYQADLAAFTQAQQAAAAEYARTAEIRFGKSKETDALVEANATRTADAIASKEKETQEKIAAAAEAAAEQLEALQQQRVARHAEQLNRIASAEQSLADAQSRAQDAVTSGEAEVRAARLKASGDVKGAEEVLARARIESIERTLAAEVRRHETVIGNLQREVAVQERLAATTGNEQTRIEAQTRIREITAQIGAEEAAIVEARAKSTTELERQKTAMEGVAAAAVTVESVTARIAEAQARATEALNEQIAAQQAQVQALNDAWTSFSHNIADLQRQLPRAGVEIGGSLGGQISQLQQEIVMATGAQRIALVKQLEQLLEANKEQLHADQVAAQIAQEWKQLDERRNQILEQIRAEQQKLTDALLTFSRQVAQNANPGKPVFAGGGVVPGAPGQPVDITAHAGEGILPTDIMAQLTRRRGEGRRFQRGGIVPPGPRAGGAKVVNLTVYAAGVATDIRRFALELGTILRREGARGTFN